MQAGAEKKGVWERLQEVDSRIIYLLLWIVILWPLISPIGLPISISAGTREYFKMIDDLKPGSRVVLSYDLSFAGLPELGPMTLATLHHLLTKDVKIYICSFWEAGSDIAADDIKALNPEKNYGKVYGRDYIHMGYNPMREVGMAQFASDVYKAFPTDYINKKPLETYEIMKGVSGAKDFDLLISIQSGTPGNPEWVRQWIAPFGIPYILGALGVSVPEVAPYYNAGQVKAFIAGLRSAAEYELLVGRRGVALAQQDPLSTTHILVILFVVIGNLGYFFTRAKGKR
ncbi:hypothetical protein KEJ49_01495 [Candidatus Bathyarchaeota archaeon]|nr:hypothetical protein [Candidatus Bathyarchaeota archaeon]